ncbi:thiamine phosphate synthase [Roseivirga thermotolerans]|uniref:thiamine phosphate synthase n=1 Tax=Roseivirga thermotolerans TaxID=1758176 RepID=UPI00273F9B74|nr:thiamine phosphate synthase [Roseivirga thermotolerans]
MKRLEGVYLVADPAIQGNLLFSKLQEALRAGVDVLQLWNHWPPEFTHSDKIQLAKEVVDMAEPYGTPVLMNEDWELALQCNAAGVHFDTIPQDWPAIKEALKGRLVGFTVGNNVERIRWAQSEGADYVSFCALFPSASVDSCEIVRPETVLMARSISSLPIFLSGGIRPDNLKKLAQLPFDGVAIISGIMNTEDPARQIGVYRALLHELKATKKN